MGSIVATREGGGPLTCADRRYPVKARLATLFLVALILVLALAILLAHVG